MRILILLALTGMSFAITAPASAQDGMMSGGMHPGAMAHMSAADTHRMQSCSAMSHARMMRSASCRRMMRMHPDMMRHEGSMSHDNMMPSGH